MGWWCANLEQVVKGTEVGRERLFQKEEQELAGSINLEIDIFSSARGLGVDRKFVPIFTVKMLVRTCTQKVMGTGRLKRVAKAWVSVQTRDRES